MRQTAEPQLHGLFYAIRLAPIAGTLAIDAMQRLMGSRLPERGKVALGHLHTTLHHLGEHPDAVPEGTLLAAVAAGGDVDMAPFGIAFDRIGSLGPRMGGLALTGGAELRKLRDFQRALAAAMKSAGIGRYIRTKFSPHVSLLYCDEHVAIQPIEPIRWEATELVLIESLIGQGVHDVRGTWPLQTRQIAFSGW